MNDFFRDLFRFIGRHRRGLFAAFLTLCGVWVALLVLSYRLSTETSFCDDCHYEDPFVESWKTSSHAEVGCVNCHAPATFGGKVNRSIGAIAATWRYWFGIHEKIPRAEIDDRACLQSGCHETRLIEGPIKIEKGILFDHAHHLGRELRGMKLRCTSCHSQIVQGAHMETTRETCFLCHFKNLPRGEAVSGCKCHGAPEEIVVHEGFEFRHAQYLTLGVVCEECHVDVTPGTGEVPKATCMSCHNARLEAMDDVAFMHRKHVLEHSVDCASCHQPVGHRDVNLVRSLETTCGACHAGEHNPQRDVFMGIGAEGVAPYPSIMFKAQVGCDGCHRETMREAGGGRIAKATGRACVMCHGRGFDTMLDEWRETVTGYFGALEPLRGAARRSWESAGASAKEKAREPYERAEKNLDFLRDGRPEHNLVYAKLVLLKAQDDLNSALQALQPSWTARTPLTFSEEDLRGNCTASCHANLRKAKIVQFEGLELTHNDHVYKHNLACTYCHDNSGVHGAVKLKRENCLGCHHTQENRDCGSCHKNQRRMVEGTGGFGTNETPAIMQGVDCADCHVDLRGGNNRDATLAACVGCHEAGYDDLVAGWQEETSARTETVSGRLAEVRRLAVTAVSRGIDAETIRRAEKLRTEAEANLDLIAHDRSRGVHNTEYAAGLLDAAERFLAEAGTLLGG